MDTLVYRPVPFIPTTGHQPPSPCYSTPDLPNSSFPIPTSSHAFCLCAWPTVLENPWTGGLTLLENPWRGLRLDAAQYKTGCILSFLVLQASKMDPKTGSQCPVLGPRATMARNLVTHRNQKDACAARREDLETAVEKGQPRGGDTAVLHLH